MEPFIAEIRPIEPQHLPTRTSGDFTPKKSKVVNVNRKRIAVEASPPEFRQLIMEEYGRFGPTTLECEFVSDDGHTIVFDAVHTCNNRGAARSDAAAFAAQALAAAYHKARTVDFGRDIKPRIYDFKIL